MDGVVEIGLAGEMDRHWMSDSVFVMRGLEREARIHAKAPAHPSHMEKRVLEKNLEEMDGRVKPGHDGISIMPPPVFRFAPSPNGLLHLGHACSALLNSELARRSGGRFLLRIEDIDATRCRPEFEAAIYQDLAWLGIAWETPVRRQSEHLADYRAALDRLSALGLLYPSFESRAEVARLVAERETKGAWPRDPDGAPLYPGTARSLPAEERERLLRSGVPYALRLDMAAAMRLAGDLTWTERGSGPDGETGKVIAQPETWGDVILARKETPTSYHLSVVIDDALGDHRGGARSGSVPVDQRAPAAAKNPEPAAAGLSSSRSDPG
jgi:glutamyl-Q tRNA(Asp) synthetase